MNNALFWLQDWAVSQALRSRLTWFLHRSIALSLFKICFFILNTLFGHKTHPKWPQSDAKGIPRWLQKWSQVTPKWNIFDPSFGHKISRAQTTVTFVIKKSRFFRYCEIVVVASVTSKLNSLPKTWWREAMDCIRWPKTMFSTVSEHFQVPSLTAVEAI